MKKARLLLMFFLIGCVESDEMKNIYGFSSIVSFLKTSKIFSGKSKILVLGNNRYKVQYRFLIDIENWDIGNKTTNTYITNEDIKYKLSDLLVDTDIVLRKGKKGETVNIDNESIIKVNATDSDLYGNISLNDNYVYVSLAWIELNIGLYTFINFNNNEIIKDLEPELIIGIGETGPL